MARWEQVLDEIVRTRRRALVGYAYLLCGDLREAEDLVQEGLVRTFRRGRAATDFQLAESYVRKAILTTYLDGFRRQRHWEGIRHLFSGSDETEATGPGTPAATDARLDVQKALMTLAPRERACVVLRYYSDLTIRQVGEQLSLSEGTVKRYLSDANSKLAASLGPIDTPSDDLDVTPLGGAR
ncbi:MULTISPECIES: sigma-70 family RNA polymerase sigma factor [Oerskovia]|uniref:Sigma-70 family RNA polymerase sigma factor n=1 Tax=Oerskovia rustica TaxID=2762237 RepID=A0ABR8RRN6_9CELL|nr:sigma-70 family RNA polymerase sigma factor [Oerskovia rustica]MBD7950423.1 sigma-70 family RNA polymerase sigma factor [Oerskovia rustica]